MAKKEKAENQTEKFFYKLFLEDFLERLDFIASKEFKIVAHILSEMTFWENRFEGSYERIMKKTGIKSKQTVANTIINLRKNGFIARKQEGIYMVNPNIIFSGKNDRFQECVAKFRELQNDDKLYTQESNTSRTIFGLSAKPIERASRRRTKDESKKTEISPFSPEFASQIGYQSGTVPAALLEDNQSKDTPGHSVHSSPLAPPEVNAQPKPKATHDLSSIRIDPNSWPFVVDNNACRADWDDEEDDVTHGHWDDEEDE